MALSFFTISKLCLHILLCIIWWQAQTINKYIWVTISIHTTSIQTPSKPFNVRLILHYRLLERGCEGVRVEERVRERERERERKMERARDRERERGQKRRERKF